MAYNYGYPMAYNPYQHTTPIPNQGFGYAQASPQPQMPQQIQQQQGIVWVQGEAAAKAYPVAAGSNVLLMDSEGECFYIKSTDASGMPLPLRVFEYKEIVRTEPHVSNDSGMSTKSDFNPDEYVKKEELDELKRQLNNLNYSKKERNNNAKQSV